MFQQQCYKDIHIDYKISRGIQILIISREGGTFFVWNWKIQQSNPFKIGKNYTWFFPSVLLGAFVFMSSQRRHIQMIRSCMATLCREAMPAVRYSHAVLKVGRGHGYGQTP